MHTGGIRHAVPEIAEQHRRFAHPGTESVITTFTASSARAQQALSAGSGVIIHEWVERWGGAERGQIDRDARADGVDEESSGHTGSLRGTCCRAVNSTTASAHVKP